MPGICGVLTRDRTGNESKQLKVMVDCMLHEPFYTHGTFTSPEKGFFIGCTAIKDSFADCMPVCNETKDIILFLTGECYFDQKEIDALAHRGHRFNAGDASCLVHLYERKACGVRLGILGY